jgi:pimeloyl-ACP methyl ester carboxylesterase
MCTDVITMTCVRNIADVRVPWHMDVGQGLLLLAEGAGTVALAFAIAVAVYVLGSFALMGAHVKARPRGTSFRELVRELTWASLSQPFLPLFYLFGSRLGEGSGTPVVFVHGYMQNRIDFVFLARLLRRRGIGPMFGFNYPWWSSVPKNAARLDRFVADVLSRTGAKAVDLVCHSMGGLVAMEMMRQEAERADVRVRRCITIATPHAGIVWQGPIIGFEGASLRKGSKLLDAHAQLKLAVPTLSIYSSHDNVVHPPETSSLVKRGGRDVEVEGLAHLAILFSPAVAAHVADFLLEPEIRVPAVLDAVSTDEEDMKNPSSESERAHAR